MTGQQCYEIWLTSYYGSVQEGYNKGVKTWEQLPDKTKQAWMDVVTLAPAITKVEENKSENAKGLNSCE